VGSSLRTGQVVCFSGRGLRLVSGSSPIDSILFAAAAISQAQHDDGGKNKGPLFAGLYKSP
jgi:hypothetical protein